jgi:hypothetical protein
MMKIRLVAILLIAIIINPHVIHALERDSALFATHSMNCIWRVYTDGNLEKISCFQDAHFGYRGSSYYGENSPLISPDQRYVAAIRQDDLWIYDVEKKKLTRITEAAKPYTNEYLSIEVSTISWSWDGRKLLYSISPGDAGSGDDGFDRKKRPAKYGFYIYDIEDRAERLIAEVEYHKGKIRTDLRGSRLALLSDGKILLQSDDGMLSLYEPGSKPKPLHVYIKRKLDHIYVSRDGKWLVSCADNFTQAIKMDLKDYKVTPLSQVGSFSECQRPKFSPSGNHILYLRYTGKHEDGVPIVDIVVDDKKAYTSQRSAEYSWINDNTIAFTSGKKNDKMEVIIIDSITGEIKGRHKIKEGQHIK